MPMGMFMKENGKMIRLMVMEFIHTLMAQTMLVTGLKTSKTVKELRLGPMALNTRVVTKKERNMEKVN